MALLDGIVGCWSPSLGATGYRLMDRTPCDNHGTLTNMDAGTDWVAKPPRGLCLDYDGVNDYTDYGTQVNLGGATYASFSAWVWRATLGDLDAITRYNTNLSGGNLRGDSFGVTTWTAAGQVSLIVRGTASTDYLAFYSTEQIVASAWNHIAAAVFVNGTSSTCVMSLNGKPATVNTSHSGTRPTSFAANNSVAWQSMSYIATSGTRFYDSGRIGELAVWRAPKTVAELCELNRLGDGWIGRELTGVNRRRRFGRAAGNRRRRFLIGAAG